MRKGIRRWAWGLGSGLGLVSGLSGCLPSAGLFPAPASPSSAPGTATASFRIQVAPVLTRSCVECHVANAEFPTLFGNDGAVSLASTRSNIGRILDEVRSGRMPRRGGTNPPKLTAQQIAELEAWRAMGMPDN